METTYLLLQLLNYSIIIGTESFFSGTAGTTTLSNIYGFKVMLHETIRNDDF